MSYSIFPDIEGMEWNNTKTPKFTTTVQKSGSKRRKTICCHSYPEWEFELSFTALNKAQIQTLAGFIASVYGATVPFLWRDMEDYRQSGVPFGIGNGTTQIFQLLKTYNSTFYEPVTDIVAGSLAVYVGETLTAAYTLGDNGLITFTTAPANGTVLTADYEYYWRVAFDSDVTWSIIWNDLYKTNSIKLVSA